MQDKQRSAGFKIFWVHDGKAIYSSPLAYTPTGTVGEKRVIYQTRPVVILDSNININYVSYF